MVAGILKPFVRQDCVANLEKGGSLGTVSDLEFVFATCRSPIMHLVCPPNFAKALFSISLGNALIPRRNQKQHRVMHFFAGVQEGQPRCIMGDVQMSSCLVPRRTLLKSSRFDSAENVEGLVSSPEPLGLISKGVSRPRDQKKRSPNYKSIYDFRPPKTTTDDCKRFSPSRTLSESSPQGIKGHHDPRTVSNVNENISYKLIHVALFSKFISIIPTHLVMKMVVMRAERRG